jgi:hypothetical protein
LRPKIFTVKGDALTSSLPNHNLVVFKLFAIHLIHRVAEHVG